MTEADMEKKNTYEGYEELRNASPEELLEAVCGFYDKQSATGNFVSGLKIGFKIAGPDGWKEVAPIWLAEYRALHKQPFAHSGTVAHIVYHEGDET